MDREREWINSKCAKTPRGRLGEMMTITTKEELVSDFT